MPRRAFDASLCKHEAELVLQVPDQAAGLDFEDCGVGPAAVEAEDGGQEVSGGIVGRTRGLPVDWRDGAGDARAGLAGEGLAKELVFSWSGHWRRGVYYCLSN